MIREVIIKNGFTYHWYNGTMTEMNHSVWWNIYKINNQGKLWG
jgi:hypothetical protein